MYTILWERNWPDDAWANGNANVHDLCSAKELYNYIGLLQNLFSLIFWAPSSISVERGHSTTALSWVLDCNTERKSALSSVCALDWAHRKIVRMEKQAKRIFCNSPNTTGSHQNNQLEKRLLICYKLPWWQRLVNISTAHRQWIYRTIGQFARTIDSLGRCPQHSESR